jgi:hypothetical protein
MGEVFCSEDTEDTTAVFVWMVDVSMTILINNDASRCSTPTWRVIQEASPSESLLRESQSASTRQIMQVRQFVMLTYFNPSYGLKPPPMTYPQSLLFSLRSLPLRMRLGRKAIGVASVAIRPRDELLPFRILIYPTSYMCIYVAMTLFIETSG